MLVGFTQGLGYNFTKSLPLGAVHSKLHAALPQDVVIIMPNLDKLYEPAKAFSNEHSPSKPPQDIENGVILYIGGESLGLTNLLVTHSSCEVSGDVVIVLNFII